MGKLKVPSVTFQTRQNDEWVNVTSDEYFKGKRVVVFSLPGAFTPIWSTQQVPQFEWAYEDFQAQGIDEVYCMSVNDAFVMNEWKKSLSIDNVKFIGDGNGEFTRKMGYLVEKKPQGFGERSWRYSMYVVDGEIQKIFEEPGFEDNVTADPYENSNPDTMLEYLKS